MEQFDQSYQSLAGVHILDRPYQAARTLLAEVAHFLVFPLSRELDGLQIAGMSSHLNTHIDCMTLAPGSTALVLVEAMAVVVGVGDSACRLT